MYKTFLSLLAGPLLVLPAMAQKAYDAVYYKGKTQNVSVLFTLADGYTAGCELQTTDLKTRKTSRFMPEEGVADEHKQLKFYHFSPSQKHFSDYFIIDGIEEVYDKVPGKLYGNYYFNGKAYSLVLTRKK